MSDKRGITRIIRTTEEFEAALAQAHETYWRPKPWVPEPVDADIVKALVGWTIVAVTRDPTPHIEGGLMFILERGPEGVERQEVTLGYTELGEWLHSFRRLP